jgi:hypothetical protein
MDICLRVLDLPMDMMNRANGDPIGGWIDKYIYVGVDEEVIGRGKEFTITIDVIDNHPLRTG